MRALKPLGLRQSCSKPAIQMHLNLPMRPPSPCNIYHALDCRNQEWASASSYASSMPTSLVSSRDGAAHHLLN